MRIRATWDGEEPLEAEVFYRPQTVTLLMDEKPPMLVLTATTHDGECVSMVVPVDEAVDAAAKLVQVVTWPWGTDEDDEPEPGALIRLEP